MIPYLIGFGLVSLGTVLVLKFRAIYLVIIQAFIQNFSFAFLFTSGLVSVNALRGAILIKEFILLFLFVYSTYKLFKSGRRMLTTPFYLLMSFTAYCAVFGLIYLTSIPGGLRLDDFRALREVSYPLEIFTVAVGISFFKPALSRRVLRFTIYYLTVVCAFSLLIQYGSGRSFWLDNANVALYNVEVKGDFESAQVSDLGIAGSSLGRSSFTYLSDMRLSGLFADPLSFGFALGIPVLLLVIDDKRSLWRLLQLALLSICVFLTFSRSAWILIVLSYGIWLLLQGKVRRGILFSVLCVVFVFAVPSLYEFIVQHTFMVFVDANMAYQHVAGVIQFYSGVLFNPSYVAGRGIGLVQIGESGLSYIEKQFGLVPLLLFLAFWVAFAAKLRKQGRTGKTAILSNLGIGICLATILLLNFSYYPFSFIGYLPIWLFLGYVVVQRSASYHRNVGSLDQSVTSPMF